MELNKPYVWIKTVPDITQTDPVQPQLEIRCNCGEYRTLNIEVAVESIEDDRYIIEIPIGSGEAPPESFLYTTQYYDPARHTKITVRIMDRDIMKGFCTVKPSADFFS